MNIGDIFAAVGLSGVAIFTVSGMYFDACRRATIDPASEKSKLVLEKFPNESDLQTFDLDYKNEISHECDLKLSEFSEAVSSEINARHKGKTTHPKPSATARDFL